MKEKMIIGHLTDLHLNGSGSRHQKLATALEKAKQLKVNHLVLTGDLSANGKAEHFAELGWALRDWKDSSVTIVPGNHDGGRAFDQALEGPSLGRFRKTSKEPVDLGSLKIFPVDTRFHARALVFRALGRIGETNLPIPEIISSATEKTTIVACHHGPQSHPLGFFDGLVGRDKLNALLGRLTNLRVLCGHDHRVLDLGRIHVAASVAHHGDPLRLYEVGARSFRPTYQSSVEGNYFSLGAIHIPRD
jgi:3',5'-cyclic AMP phosphodiesterase CpdA